jgi:hypothetical protein
MLNCLFLIIGELKPWEYCRCISKYILTQELLLNIHQNDILTFGTAILDWTVAFSSLGQGIARPLTTKPMDTVALKALEPSSL